MSISALEYIAKKNAIALRILDKAFPEPNSGCLLWGGAYRGLSKYSVARIDGKPQSLVRWMHKEIHGRELGRWELCCHKCDTPQCINLDHIFIGSMSDNMKDMSIKKRGSFNKAIPYNRRLSDKDVRTIFQLKKQGLASPEIARRFGVNRSCVYKILTGEAYKNVSQGIAS